MGKPRKQLEIPKLDKNGQRRGGARPGAGRKRKDGTTGGPRREPHKPRALGDPRFPRHIVLGVLPEIGNLRKRHFYAALRLATIAVAMRELNVDEVKGEFRIIHISIQKTHVHLLVEADNNLALSRGMQSFMISAAKHINRAYSDKMKLATRRRGPVFRDRYHQEMIETPQQARDALSYVLNNWRKHGEDSDSKVDPFSTGHQFMGWREGADAIVDGRGADAYEPLTVYVPKTWLLSAGWRKAGTISFSEVPTGGIEDEAPLPLLSGS